MARALLTTKQLAEALQCKTEVVRRWCREETIPFYRIGKEYRFDLSEILISATPEFMKLQDGEGEDAKV